MVHYHAKVFQQKLKLFEQVIVGLECNQQPMRLLNERLYLPMSACLFIVLFEHSL